MTGWIMLAIAAAAIAGFALFEIGKSFPNYQVRNKQNPTDNQITTDTEVSKVSSQPSQERPNIKDEVERWNKLVAYSTIVMAVFTGALVIATIMLWKSGEKHSERALRAYIGVDAAEIQNFGVEKQIKSVLRIKNSGQTPAYNLTTRHYMKLGKFPVTDFAADVKERRTTSFLSPGQDVFANVLSDKPITAEQHKAVVDGESGLYVVFELRYRDVFEKRERVMNYRAYFKGNGTDPGTTLELSQTEDGNNAN